MSTTTAGASVAPRRIGEYDLYETIGTGSYSTVKRAIREDTGVVVAVKVVEKQRINRDWNRQQLRRELELTRSFCHPHVCGLLDAMQTSRNVYLVFPHAPNGDLFSAIVNAGRLSESTSRRWFNQLVSGVAHVHSKGVVHRDIKPENILIDASNNLLLSDFGFCAAQAAGEKVFALCGSPHTIAPEVLASDSGYCGKAADVWSLGVVLFVMLGGRYPFAASSMDDLLPEIQRGEWTFPRGFPIGAAGLVRKMLVVDPTARCSVDDILRDIWMCGAEGVERCLKDAAVAASAGSSSTCKAVSQASQSSASASDRCHIPIGGFAVSSNAQHVAATTASASAAAIPQSHGLLSNSTIDSTICAEGKVNRSDDAKTQQQMSNSICTTSNSSSGIISLMLSTSGTSAAAASGGSANASITSTASGAAATASRPPKFPHASSAPSQPLLPSQLPIPPRHSSRNPPAPLSPPPTPPPNCVGSVLGMTAPAVKQMAAPAAAALASPLASVAGLATSPLPPAMADPLSPFSPLRGPFAAHRDCRFDGFSMGAGRGSEGVGAAFGMRSPVKGIGEEGVEKSNAGKWSVGGVALSSSGWMDASEILSPMGMGVDAKEGNTYVNV